MRNACVLQIAVTLDDYLANAPAAQVGVYCVRAAVGMRRPTRTARRRRSNRRLPTQSGRCDRRHGLLRIRNAIACGRVLFSRQKYHRCIHARTHTHTRVCVCVFVLRDTAAHSKYNDYTLNSNNAAQDGYFKACLKPADSGYLARPEAFLGQFTGAPAKFSDRVNNLFAHCIYKSPQPGVSSDRRAVYSCGRLRRALARVCARAQCATAAQTPQQRQVRVDHRRAQVSLLCRAGEPPRLCALLVSGRHAARVRERAVRRRRRRRDRVRRAAPGRAGSTSCTGSGAATRTPSTSRSSPAARRSRSRTERPRRRGRPGAEGGTWRLRAGARGANTRRAARRHRSEPSVYRRVDHCHFEGYTQAGACGRVYSDAQGEYVRAHTRASARRRRPHE